MEELMRVLAQVTGVDKEDFIDGFVEFSALVDGFREMGFPDELALEIIVRSGWEPSFMRKLHD